MTISSLVVQILADTSGITRGMARASKDLKIARQAFTDSLTEADKLQQALKSLESVRGLPKFQGDEGAARYAALESQIRSQLDPAYRELARVRRDAAAALTAEQAQDPRQRYREEITLLKQAGVSQEEFNARKRQLAQLLPEVQAAQQQLERVRRDAAAAVAAERAQDPLRRYREEITLLKQAGVSQEEFNARKRQLAQLLPQVQQRQQQVAASQRQHAQATQRAAQLIAELNPKEAAYRQGMEEATRLRRAQLLTEQQFVAKKQQLIAALHAERNAEAAALRARVRSPFAAFAEDRSRNRQLRQSGAISGREQLLANTQSLGGLMSQLPVVSGLGNALSSMHPAMIAVSGAFKGISVAAAGAAAYLGTVTYAVHKQMSAIAQLHQTSTELGMSLRATIAMDRAARLANVDVRVLADAMSKARVKLGEAALGGQEAASTFARLGLDVRQMSALAPEEFLGQMTAALQRVSSPAERAALAQKVFGEQVKTLMPLLASGSVSMQDWIADAERARLIVGESDARNVREMFAAWQMVSDALSGIFRQVAVQLSPTITKIARDVKDFLEGPAGEGAITFVFLSLKTAAYAAAAAIDWLRRQFNQVSDTVDGFGIGVRQAAIAVLTLKRAWASFTGDSSQADALTAQIATHQRAIDETTQRIKQHWSLAGQHGAVAYLASLEQGLAQQPKVPEPATTAIDAAAVKEPTDKITELTKRLQEQIATWSLTTDEVERWKLAQEGATDATLQSIAALQEQAAAAQRAKQLRDNVQQMTTSLQEQIATWSLTADEIERWKLAQQGANDATLQNVAALQAQAAAAQRAKQLRDNVQQMTSSLQEQIATWSLTADEVERWKLAQQGASDATLASISALQRQAAIASHFKELRQEADRLKQTLKTPAQQYADSLQQLYDMLDSGMLTLAEFTAAKDKLAKPVEINLRTSSIDAVAAGSLDMLEKLDTYREASARKQEVSAIEQQIANNPRRNQVAAGAVAARRQLPGSGGLANLPLPPGATTAPGAAPVAEPGTTPAVDPGSLTKALEFLARTAAAVERMAGSTVVFEEVG